MANNHNSVTTLYLISTFAQGGTKRYKITVQSGTKSGTGKAPKMAVLQLASVEFSSAAPVTSVQSSGAAKAQ
jgi:hypothetical protein